MVSEPAQFASFFERLDRLDKCLEESLARVSESENDAARARATDHVDSVAVSSKKVRWEPDPPGFGEQEELDQEELYYLQYDLPLEELGADGEYGLFQILWLRPCVFGEDLDWPSRTVRRALPVTSHMFFLASCLLRFPTCTAALPIHSIRGTHVSC